MRVDGKEGGSWEARMRLWKDLWKDRFYSYVHRNSGKPGDPNRCHSSSFLDTTSLSLSPWHAVWLFFLVWIKKNCRGTFCLSLQIFQLKAHCNIEKRLAGRIFRSISGSTRKTDPISFILDVLWFFEFLVYECLWLHVPSEKKIFAKICSAISSFFFLEKFGRPTNFFVDNSVSVCFQRL